MGTRVLHCSVLGGLLAGLLTLSVVAFKLHSLNLSIAELAASETMSETTTATWVSGGITIEVTTPREAGWSKAKWAQEHRENVDAMLVEFPKDD